MSSDAELITVFRSADEDARDDAAAIRELLAAEGLQAIVLDDSAPGVPEGAWEVRVPPAQTAMAEELIARANLPEAELPVGELSDLEMETVFRASSGTTSELEAMSVQGILEGAGIATVMIGDAVLPNLAFEVRVAKENAGQARQVLEEDKAGGLADRKSTRLNSSHRH